MRISAVLDSPPPKDEAEALERSAPHIIEAHRALLSCVKEHRMASLTPKRKRSPEGTRNEAHQPHDRRVREGDQGDEALRMRHIDKHHAPHFLTAIIRFASLGRMW